MSISERQREELLSFNNGHPFIIVERSNTNGRAEYGVTVFVRTIVSPAVDYVDSVTFVLTFTPSFPQEHPELRLDKGHLFHPNFTDEGKWLSSELMPNESLTDYLMRLVNALEFREIDTNKLANRNAMAWYNRQKNTGLFPLKSDNGTIPPITIYRTNLKEPSHVSPRIQLGEIHYG